MKNDKYKIYKIIWDEIPITIKYCSHWHTGNWAHLEIIADDGGWLPITNTGYRSEFLPHSIIEEHGTPVSYALEWINESAKSKEWQAHKIKSKQLSLFDHL